MSCHELCSQRRELLAPSTKRQCVNQTHLTVLVTDIRTDEPSGAGDQDQGPFRNSCSRHDLRCLDDVVAIQLVISTLTDRMLRGMLLNALPDLHNLILTLILEVSAFQMKPSSRKLRFTIRETCGPPKSASLVTAQALYSAVV